MLQVSLSGSCPSPSIPHSFSNCRLVTPAIADTVSLRAEGADDVTRIVVDDVINLPTGALAMLSFRQLAVTIVTAMTSFSSVAVAQSSTEVDPAPFEASAQRFLDAYAERDAEAIGALFTEGAEFLDEFGDETNSRQAIVAMFRSVFESSDSATFDEISITKLRAATESVVIEEGLATSTPQADYPPTTSKYVVVHVKQDDGRWLIDLLKSFGPSELGHAEHVSALAWLVGDWVSEDSDHLVETSCGFSDNGTYLLRSFKIRSEGEVVLDGIQRIGWDPAAKILRSWTFDTEGGFFSGTWQFDGQRWVVSQHGTTSSGKQATATAAYEVVDREMVRWQFVSRVVDAEILPRGPVTIMVRKPPAPLAGPIDSSTDATR